MSVIVEPDVEVYRVTVADGFSLRVYELDVETLRTVLVAEVNVAPV